MRSALLNFCCAALLSCLALTKEISPIQTSTAHSEQVEVNAQDLAEFRQIAHRVFDKIVALKERYPHLALINSEARREEAQNQLWIAYHYAHDVSWVPNPDYRPTFKVSKRLKSFSPVDGIELNLYFYEGQWPGQAVVTPFNIGDIKIVFFVEGAETPLLAALRNDIRQIMEDERAALTKTRLTATIPAADLPPPAVPRGKFDYQMQVGTVEFLPNKTVCLTIQNTSLQKAEAVHVILMDEPQTHATGLIEEKVAKGCSRDLDASATDAHYVLRMPVRPTNPEPVSIGVVRSSGGFHIQGGLVLGDLDGDGIMSAFRSCTSNEGIHLSVWDGTPGKSSRKWRRYYYLGYDVEPDCTDKDYADTDR